MIVTKRVNGINTVMKEKNISLSTTSKSNHWLINTVGISCKKKEQNCVSLSFRAQREIFQQPAHEIPRVARNDNSFLAAQSYFFKMASADGKNSGKCDKNFVVAVLAILIGAIVTLATPELRKIFGLEQEQPVPVVQETPSKPTAQTPTSVSNDNPSFSTEYYTLAEHKWQFVVELNTALSFSFESVSGVSIVSLVISPVGKTPLTRAMLNGRSHKFTSSSGVFIVTVLDIDWEGKTVAVQVSRKQ